MARIEGDGLVQVLEGLVGDPVLHADHGLFVLILGIFLALGRDLLLGRRAGGQSRPQSARRTRIVRFIGHLASFRP